MSRKIAILIGFMALVVAIGAGGGGLSEAEKGAAAEVEMAAEYTAQPGGFNAIGGTATVNDAAYDLTFFQHYGVNPFIDTEDDHFSTFAVDVDTASYSVARRFVQDGNIPVPDSVRVEEFVNYFEQDYAPPESGAFAVHIEGSPSPFGGDKHWMLRVGLEGKEIPPDARKSATLVFAIDVSGSMGREDRLGLVQRSLRLLVEELRPADRVGIVVYGNRGRVLLEPTEGGEKQAIMGAINSLVPSGLHLRRRRPAPRLQDGSRRGAARSHHPGAAAVRRCRQRGTHRRRIHPQPDKAPSRCRRQPHHHRIRYGQLQRRAHGAVGQRR